MKALHKVDEDGKLKVEIGDMIAVIEGRQVFPNGSH